MLYHDKSRTVCSVFEIKASIFQPVLLSTIPPLELPIWLGFAQHSSSTLNCPTPLLMTRISPSEMRLNESASLEVREREVHLAGRGQEEVKTIGVLWCCRNGVSVSGLIPLSLLSCQIVHFVQRCVANVECERKRKLGKVQVASESKGRGRGREGKGEKSTEEEVGEETKVHCERKGCRATARRGGMGRACLSGSSAHSEA